MNIKSKLFLALSSAVLTACVTANADTLSTTNVKDEHTVTVYKDCVKVRQFQMNEDQIKAYRDLKDSEKVMKGLEIPLHDMESKLEKYTTKMDEISAKAVFEDDDKLVINKKLLKQQELVAAEIEKIVEAHELDIESIESHAEVIEKAAREFERALHETIPDDDNVHIQIGTKNRSWRCESFS